MTRPICTTCIQRHAAVNYIRKGKRYYRTECESCLRLKKGKAKPKPNWSLSGYKKKLKCDMCGFTARWAKQIIVFYADGDLRNTKQNNLKSICLNCSVVIEKQDMPWTKDISPDN